MTAAPGPVAAVTGGTVVTPDGERPADVLISGGRIAAVLPPGAGAGGGGPAVDARGCYVLPGGVDPHTHLMPDIHRATTAAARGGTTTVLSFTAPQPGETDLAALLRSLDEVAAGRPVIDVGLHAMIYDPCRTPVSDLARMRAAGAGAIKIFMAYPELGIMCPDRRLPGLLAGARDAGLMTAVHCENGPFIESLTEAAVRAGRRGAGVYAATRPPETEEASVAAVLAAAALAGAPCYLVHLSTAGALDQVRLARQRDRPPVLAEVCPHHLLLDEGRYTAPDAGRYLVAPPLRPAADAAALWDGLASGTVDTVGSDHCQHQTPLPGELAPAGQSWFYGLAGIGARLPLLLAEGQARGLPMTRLAQLASAGPARAFGHYPRKGALVAGADADIAVWDPAGQTVLDTGGLGDGTGDSVYAGRAIRGRVTAVLARGRLLVAGGEPADRTAGGAGTRGRYLAAGPPPAWARDAELPD
jgi:dihydropyrimidinase